MSFNFPDAPTLNQTFMGYIWDGEKWASQATVANVGAVRYDTVQGLTAAQQMQGRQNIAAASFDVMAYSGMQINGDAAVSQENGTTSIYGGPGGTAIGKYVADGWRIESIGAQSISWAADPVLTAATSTTPPPGYPNAVSVWLNTANASPAASDYLFYRQVIEGQRFRRLAWGTASAQPLSIGFWIAAHVPGNYSGSVRNAPVDRSYVFDFTISAADTWEWKTVTLPGCTAGAWPNMEIAFTIMSGSSFKTAAAGVWTSGNWLGSTTTINGAANATNRVSITGLIVLPGIELPTSAQAPLVMRPFQQELLLCRRYYQKIINPAGYAVGNGAATLFYHSFSLPVLMRTSPTVGITGNGQLAFTAGDAGYTGTGIAANFSTEDTYKANLVCSTAVPMNKVCACIENGNAVTLSARF